MLSVLVWNSVRLISSSHEEVLLHHLSEEAGLLANLLAPGLATSDRAILLDALSLAGQDSNIVFATVQNASGETMGSIGNIPEVIEPTRNLQDLKNQAVYEVDKTIFLSGQELGKIRLGYSTQYVHSLIKQTRFQNTTIAGIEIALSVLVAWLVGMILTKGLRQLEEGAKALKRDELDHRIHLNSDDEIGHLAKTFNELADHLSTTREALVVEHQALEQKTQHLETLMNTVDAVIVEADPRACQFSYVSREAENLLGYPLSDWFQPNFLLDHVHTDESENVKRYFARYSKSPGTSTTDFRLKHIDGHWVDVRSINTFIDDDKGELICRSLFIDITEQKLNEQRIVYLAEHDVLTGLFNRGRFQEELGNAIEYSTRYNQQGSLMFIDLDQFKYINDTMGHHAGDEYLSSIANQLSGAIRKVDIIGRLGGDEFGVILPNTSEEQAIRVAEHLMKILSVKNSELTGNDSPVTASIGIVNFPKHGTVASNLLALADAAMYTAKEKGRNTFHAYSSEDTQLKSMHAKIQWEQKIREALEKDLFVLHFQPIFQLDNRTITHYEVLLRMKDGEGGLIPPTAFLDIAERFGMIREIDHWVLNQAIRLQAASNQTDSPISLAINLSGKHYGNPQILEWIKEQIDESGADPHKLIFEITETAAVENITMARRFTDALHSIGCRIALDDFGVGFSSFNNLKHLPVDIIKLDGSFIRNLGNDNFDKVFVNTMGIMARGLHISCIAEFVESESVIDVLRDLGVAMGQGYHLARPEALNDEFMDQLNLNSNAPQARTQTTETC